MATTNYAGTGGGQYERNRRGIEDRYTQGSAQNAYGRFISQQRGQRNLNDQTRLFKQGYAPYVSQYGARGLAGGGVSSGVRDQGVGRYVGDYYRDFGRTQQDLAQNMQTYDLNQAQMDLWRQEELSNIDLDRQRAIASTAANLNALRNYLGGI